MSELFPETETDVSVLNENKQIKEFKTDELNKFIKNRINESETKTENVVENKSVITTEQQEDLDSMYQFNEKTRVIYELLFTLYEKKSYGMLNKIITQQFYDEFDHELLAAYIIKNEYKNVDISYLLLKDICLNLSECFDFTSLFTNKNKLLKTKYNLFPLLHYSIKINLYNNHKLEDSILFKYLLYSLKEASVGFVEKILDINLIDVDIHPFYNYIIDNCHNYSLYQPTINKISHELYLDKQKANKKEKDNQYNYALINLIGNDLGKKIEQLQTEINQLKEQKNSNEQNKSNEYKNSNEQEINDLHNQNGELLQQISKLEDKLLYKTNDLEIVKKINTDLEVENIQLKNQVEELLVNNTKSTELKVKLNLLEKKLELIEAEKKHHSEMNTQLKENNFEELLQSQQDNEELQSENDKLKSEIEVSNRTIQHMNDVFNEQDYKIKNLKREKDNEIEIKQSLISEKDNEIKRLQLRHNKLVKINENYINKIAKLESVIRKKKVNHKLKSDEDTLYRNFMVYLRKSKYELDFIKWLESNDNQNKFMKIISEYFDDLYRFEYQESKPIITLANGTKITSVNNVFTINFDDIDGVAANLTTLPVKSQQEDEPQNEKNQGDDIVKDFIEEMKNSNYTDMENNQTYENELQYTDAKEDDDVKENQIDDESQNNNNTNGWSERSLAFKAMTGN